MKDTDCLEQEELKIVQGGAVCKNIRRCAKVLWEFTCDNGETAKYVLELASFTLASGETAVKTFSVEGNDNLIETLVHVEAWEDKCLRSGERKKGCYRHAFKSTLVGHSDSAGSGQQVLDTDKALACYMPSCTVCGVNMRPLTNGTAAG
ncbi:hypothetical protein, unlikely [Trypanosoma congolense IL3000]|uniref:Uncharacterized protein n=1 Tax=Trypanosoma congolense (strain IL3000) TaxID=1068625 RepID=F9WH94_TRYCI|nr:hypothetical protein, unlikely [Trypanosoma congolense IL3000]